MTSYSLWKGINCPGCHVNAFWSKLMKEWWGGGVGNPALCVVSDLWWAGKTWRDWDNIIPPHRHRLCHEIGVWAGEKMADKEEWEEMKQEACVSTGASSFLLHPFTFLHRGAKKRRSLCVFVCVHSVWLVIPVRGFVLFLHYLSSLSSEQFSFQPII